MKQLHTLTVLLLFVLLFVGPVAAQDEWTDAVTHIEDCIARHCTSTDDPLSCALALRDLYEEFRDDFVGDIEVANLVLSTSCADLDAGGSLCDVVDCPVDPYEIIDTYPLRAQIEGLETSGVFGPDDAEVVLVQFSDIECSFCGRLLDVVQEVQADYPEQVRVHFMSYPLNSDCNDNTSTRYHTDACTAASAVVCAREQGLFWELISLLFDNPTLLTASGSRDMAVEAGLDMVLYDECISQPRVLDVIRDQADRGYEAQASIGETPSGTPFTFVNGLLIYGSVGRPALEAVIQAEIEAGGE